MLGKFVLANEVDVQTQVLIVGAGPVGMMTATLLAQQGIPSLLIERRRGPAAHPKGRGFNSRSMELFRQTGMLADMLAAQPSLESVANVANAKSIVDPALVVMPFQGTSTLVKNFSPAPNVVGGQDIVEMVQLNHLRRNGLVTLMYDCEVAAIEQHGDHVVATARRSDGATLSVAAQYVIASDGARSPCRDLCGRVMRPRSPVLGQNVNILFRADLSAYMDKLTNCAFLTLLPKDGTPGLRGILAIMSTVRSPDERTFNIVLRPDENPDDITMATAADWMRRELELPHDFAIEIISISRWDAHARLIDQFRDQRVFFAGDAARTITPAGALGMNTGLIDANNLAWRIALAVRGFASDRLLDDYDTERMAHSEEIVSASVDNLKGVVTGHRSDGPAAHAPPKAGSPPPNRSQMGLYLGFTYASGSVIPDGHAHPKIDDPRNDYIPSAVPGARAPHLWLDPRYGLSTIDLFGGAFSLLTLNAPHWAPAVDEIVLKFGFPLRLCDVRTLARSEPIQRDWLKLYDMTDSGAVLVRPDGMVAWRQAGRTDDATATLIEAIETLTGNALANVTLAPAKTFGD
jgi:putative polyketide hydroxylase